MPQHRGRASRACTPCRKQKTRCYESGVPGRPCFRCERLRQRCSFVQTPPLGPDVASYDVDARLTRLEQTTGALLERLGEDSGSIMQMTSHPSPGIQVTAPSSDNTRPSSKPDSQLAAPVFVIRDLASDMGIKPPDTSSQAAGLDGLIAPDLALQLFAIFLKHYGRWVLLDPEDDPKASLARASRSPLLLCACFLIAIQHTTEALATSLAPKLYQCTRSLISDALLVAPQPIEFFQAALVLSMWSTTAGKVPLNIDSWLLSGFSLQHSHSSPLFDPVHDAGPTTQLSKTTLDNWCLWNHLCLVHLHYCIGTSRKSMLYASHIERCRAILDSDHATNYESRMVAEIYLYWTVYENISSDSIDLLKCAAHLQDWKKEWQFVLLQPRAQFLLMGFHFAHLLLYDQSLKTKTTRARESVLSELIHHSTSIIHLAIDTTDERTRHLSDHIYHMITFAAIIICRLFSGYSEQLSQSHNLAELDSLIFGLVEWLQSIGLPCHAACTLGHIIAKVHQRVRPGVEKPEISEQNDTWPGEDLLSYFPEFLGLEPTADGNWDLLPSWGFSPG